MAPVYVVLNAGSSSLKFQIFEAAAKGDPQPLYRGLVDGIGGPAPRFTAKDRDGKVLADERLPERQRKPFGHEEALVHLVA